MFPDKLFHFLIHYTSLPEAQGNVADVKPQVPGCLGAYLAGVSSAQLSIFLYPAVVLETLIVWEGRTSSGTVYCAAVTIVKQLFC